MLSDRYPVPPHCCGKSCSVATPALVLEPEGSKGRFDTRHPGDTRWERWHRERDLPCVSSDLHLSAIFTESLPEQMNL